MPTHLILSFLEKTKEQTKNQPKQNEKSLST